MATGPRIAAGTAATVAPTATAVTTTLLTVATAVTPTGTRTEAVAALHATAELLQRGHTVDAYTAMLRGHPHYLKHLGPSFFTKFLYAADACDHQPGRALILDQFVALALKDLDDWDIPRYGPWEPSTYAKWIDHAHRVAAAEGVRADAVEMAYFKHGRKAAARR